ncbi:UNVERIFIED_CONTAM: AP-2 complex subunit alpha-2 [Trichonephila clavipes]
MPELNMHGLSLFISDIRNCKCKEAEIMRINKELANIRSKFKKPNVLNGYNKKKYICKLIFIFLLGYDFDCGHEEAVNLLTSPKFNHKFIGYMFISVVMNEKSNLIKLVLKSIQNDMDSFNSEHQNLALKYAANMANNEMAEVLGERVLRLLFSGDTTNQVKQSAVLCLLRLYKLKPDIISDDDYSDRIVSFLSDQDLGIVTAAVSLIEALAIDSKLDKDKCLHLTIHRLNRLLKYPSLDLQDYNFYFVPAPWLSVKLLKLLKCLPPPVEHLVVKAYLTESIEIIFNKALEPPKTKKIEHRNCKNAVLFEAISYIYHVNADSSLQIRACNALDLSLKQNEANLRYLVLETMKMFADSAPCKERIKHQIKIVKDSLRNESDTCIRQKAADLLYTLCDRNNVNEIVEYFFDYLENSEMTVREEIVLKIAILSENYFTDRRYYINIILRLLKMFGEFVTRAVWFRFIQIVTNTVEVHGYAAKSVFEALQIPPYHETFIAVTAYVLGEYGNLIAGDEKSKPSSQLQMLHSKFSFCSETTKAMLLTTYMKFFNLFPETKHFVKNIFVSNMKHSDTEIQQRATEYSKLCDVASRNCLATVLDEMPRYENQSSSVETALQKLKSKFTEMHFNEDVQNERNFPLGRSASHNDAVQNYSTNPPLLNDALPTRCSTVPQNSYLTGNHFETLIEVFSSDEPAHQLPVSQSTTTLVLTSNEEAIKNLIWHKNGVLYESNVLVIHSDGEFQKHKGSITLKYKNKTMQAIYEFLQFFPNFESDKLVLKKKICPTVLASNEETVQEIEVECLQDFTRRPALSITYNLNGSFQSLDVQIPLTLNKFIEPITLNFDQFFSKWNSIQQCHEFVTTFPAKYIMNKDLLRRKLNGLGMMILENIDKNSSNFVCAGIFYSRMPPVGILLRLECSLSTFMYRLTVRSVKKTVSEEIIKLVQFLL